MNSNNRSLWIIIAVLVVINIASLGSFWIFRGHKSAPNRMVNTWRPDRIRDFRQEHFIPKRLGFSSEQTEAFNALAKPHQEQLVLTMGEIRVLREQLMDQVGSDNQQVAYDLINQITGKHKELEKINFDHFQRVMQLCEGDQKEAFRKIMHRAFQPLNSRMERGRLRERRRHD